MTDPSKSSPKHGSSPRADAETSTETKTNSVSQADGTGANAPRGETQAQPRSSEQKKSADVTSQTPESRQGKINPSAPNDATSEGSSPSVGAKMPANTTRDSAGEIGEPSGEGTLDAPKNPEDQKKHKKDEDEEAA